MESLSRRKLLGTAGVAAGTAAVAASPAAGAFEHGVETEPSGPPPGEAIIAYVRDVGRGEVTVMHGSNEVTYVDRALVRRLVKAAPKAGE